MMHRISLTEAKDKVNVIHEDFEIRDNMKYKPIYNHLEINDNVSYKSEFVELKTNQLTLENDTLNASSIYDQVEVVLPYSSALNFEFDETTFSNSNPINNKTIVNALHLRIDKLDGAYDCKFDGFVNLVNGDFTMLSDELTSRWINLEIDDQIDPSYKIEMMKARKCYNGAEVTMHQQIK